METKSTYQTALILLGLCYIPSSFSVKWDTFSTKTLYEWSHDVNKGLFKNIDNAAAYDNNLCTAVHVNVVVRHGARNPSDGDIEDLDGLHKKLTENKDPARFPELDRWVNRYDIAEESELVEKGREEQEKLGYRLGTRFYQLMETHYDKLKFVSSSKSRAKDSATSFYAGLKNTTLNSGKYETFVNNTLLRFYDGCTVYEEDVEDDTTNADRFYKSDTFLNVVNSIRNRLGLTVSLTTDEVYLIHEMCSFETYIYSEQNSVWCQLVSDSERAVLEYGKDVEKYYESSYGHTMNTKLACPLVRELFDVMDKALNDTWDYKPPITDPNYVAGHFLFGHSETVSQLITALGLVRDDQPLLENSMAAMTNRKFKTSHVLPYSSNVGFAIYKCDLNNNQNRTYVVKLFLNEEEVVIPACGKDLCVYNEVKQYYTRLINNCNIEEMCDRDDDGDNGAGARHGSLGLLLSTIVAAFLSTYI